MLFPITAQFSHALTKHHHAKEDTHQVQMKDFTTNCAIYHFQLNYNTIDFSSDYSFLEKKIKFEEIFVKTSIRNLFHFQYKSSRAPPYYC